MAKYSEVMNTIDAADTPEKVWALVAELARPQNGYSEEVILKNVRAYADLAIKMNHMVPRWR